VLAEWVVVNQIYRAIDVPESIQLSLPKLVEEIGYLRNRTLPPRFPAIRREPSHPGTGTMPKSGWGVQHTPGDQSVKYVETTTVITY